MAKKQPSGILNRSFKLLKMASSVATKEAAYRIGKAISSSDALPKALQTRIKQAQTIAENLSQLKGAAMKAGQLLSMDAGDLLPPEVTLVLSKLQDQAIALDTSEVIKILKKEIGEAAFKKIKNFSEEPIASASIGQVHSATIDGSAVAIKIQYPGIDKSVSSDMAILKRMVNSLIGLFGRKIDLSELMDELTTVLIWETDYNREREFMKIFYDLAKNEEQLIVPKAYDEFSTKHVLTMSLEKGLQLNRWLQNSPSIQQKTKLAHLLLNTYLTEFYSWGMVQTDPNYANFLVLDNPFKIVLLDFGATLKYSQKFRHDYKRLLVALMQQDRDLIIDISYKMGLIDSRESSNTMDLYFRMLDIAIKPFRAEFQPFDFGNKDYSNLSRDAVLDFVSSLKFSSPPRSLIFLHRKLGGLFNLLKTMDVKLNLHEYWGKMTTME